MNTKNLFRCVAAVCGIVLSIAPATAQSRLVLVEQDGPPEERVQSLLERLEIGMSALEELGRRDALEIVQRIANELRESRAGAPREENDEIKTVRRRLKVMRTAVEIFVEVGRIDAAELVERAMHAREIAIERRRDDEANRIREAAPNRAQLAEALGAAAQLYRERGRNERATALAELAETYVQQWRRRQGARAAEPEPENELDAFAKRIDAIRLARTAFAEAGDERNAEVLEGVIHYGELALEGTSDEELSRAAEKVPSKENLFEYMSWAANKYAEWGHPDRADVCRNLADYYGRQLGLEPDRRLPEREPRGDIDDLNHRMEILRFARGAFMEAGDEAGAHTVERFLHVAELQRAGASPDEIRQAFEGLSIGSTIELLQQASKLYTGWGAEARATACDRLAEYYAARERGRVTEERPTGDDAVRARMNELRQRANELEKMLDELRARIEEMRDR